MKIFISSVIAGFEEYRAAAIAAVRSLGHEPITAENFPAGVSSPRVACLQGVRDADLVVLILGAAYGSVQPVSRMSATHEEYREAKDHRPVMAFVQEGIDREQAQAAFVREVEDWAGGLFRGAFHSAEELRDLVTRSVHRFELTAATTPVDAAEMLTRALEMIPRENRNFVGRSGPLLHVAVVGGPAQTILRPVEIEQPDLARDILRDATYGANPLFDTAHGSQQAHVRGSLELTQETGAAIVINERGAIRISAPIERGDGMLGALIEENVAAAAARALEHSAEILSKIDETERLSRVAIVAAIASNGAMGWRTRREDTANPNSMSMSSMFGRGDPEPVHFQPADRPRASLVFDRDRITADLLALLRRQWL